MKKGISKYINSLDSFENKKIVLIGCTSGIGLELLKHLVLLKAQIILLAIEKDISLSLKEEYGLLDVIYYDQSSFASIDSAIKELLERHRDFEAVVLNAGVLGLNKMLDNGHPATIAINYVGARYFIDTISPLISFDVRFVMVGSFAAGLRFKKHANLRDEKLSTFDQYNISKGYIEAYFYKLSTEKKYPNLEYVLVEPGLTNTGIIHNFNKVVRFLGKYFLKWFFHSPAKASLCHLTAISSRVKNGDFVYPRGLFRLSGYPKIGKLPKGRRREYLFIK